MIYGQTKKQNREQNGPFINCDCCITQRLTLNDVTNGLIVLNII